MAIAIKAEFNTFDLADLTNDVVTVKEELAGMPMAVPQASAAAAASTSASEGTFSACGVFCSMICTGNPLIVRNDSRFCTIFKSY